MSDSLLGSLEAYKKKTLGAGMLDVSAMVGSIIYLLSEQSKFVTGQNIIVDDGRSQKLSATPD